MPFLSFSLLRTPPPLLVFSCLEFSSVLSLCFFSVGFCRHYSCLMFLERFLGSIDQNTTSMTLMLSFVFGLTNSRSFKRATNSGEPF